MQRFVLLGLLVASLLPAGSPAVAETVAHVHVLDTLPIPSFSPGEVTLQPGDRVTWDNHATRVHTVTHAKCRRVDSRNEPGECMFDTLRDRGDDLGNGDVFEVVFDSPGTFDYFCAIHRFTGRITVLSEPGLLPDLSVTDVQSHSTPLGTSQRVSGLVSNFGEASSPLMRVWFEYKSVGDEDWTRFGDIEVGPLSIGETLEVSRDWTTFNRVGDFHLRVIADGSATVLESNEENNEGSTQVHVLVEGLEGQSLPDPPVPQPVTTRVPTP